jgi:hypothetical protein
LFTRIVQKKDRVQALLFHFMHVTHNVSEELIGGNLGEPIIELIGPVEMGPGNACEEIHARIEYDGLRPKQAAVQRL